MIISLGAILVTGGAAIGTAYVTTTLYEREIKRRPAFLMESAKPASDGEVDGKTIVIDMSDKDTDKAITLTRERLVRRTAVVALTAGTALVHLQLGPTLYVANGIGYLALGTALYFVPQLERYRPQVRDGLTIYTGLTFLLYFIVRGPDGLVEATGMTTKVMEIALITLLSLEEKDQGAEERILAANTAERVTEPAEPIAEPV